MQKLEMVNNHFFFLKKYMSLLLLFYLYYFPVINKYLNSLVTL